MNMSKGSWMGRASGVLHSLLHPRRKECLLCKKRGHLQGDAFGLCHACFTRIPWIRRVLCPICGRGENCTDCLRRGQAYFSSSRSAVRYDDTMKELLARYKYRGDERLKSVIGHMMVHAYGLLQADDGPNGSKKIANDTLELFTYVPISERRLLERGFNQAEQMAVELGRRVGLPVMPLLLRSKHTDKQSFKKRSERLGDLQHVFEVSTSCAELVKSTSRSSFIIYVVDDVYTTGSTMNQCAKVLKESFPAEVFGLTWAR
ncbi:ComF family protein [Paenibacillus sedimenti]|uniref:ComF family protein n=1 Tax=Paenibacillus sedimenti TaxID=2770274 RepID=A0A926KVA5_9BACL|nr:double zinc ribbon domain-containing protein [Paenibacillus sedimenti]MBD0384187.1 ComF family protein [Paenibacillus sedimenti]